MQDVDFETGLWAVMITPHCGTLIGYFDIEAYPGQDLDDLIENERPVMVRSCFRLDSQAVPINTPNGPAMQMVRQCVPLAGCADPTSVITPVSAFIPFHAMTEDDQTRHKDLVNDLLKKLKDAKREQALNRMGIVQAGPKDVPGGLHQ